jgi:hypothetical protein
MSFLADMKNISQRKEKECNLPSHINEFGGHGIKLCL